MSCTFCGHPTPHVCWDANEASTCGNYAHARRRLKTFEAARGEVERIIEARARKPNRSEIEAQERRMLAQLKEKYEA